MSRCILGFAARSSLIHAAVSQGIRRGGASGASIGLRLVVVLGLTLAIFDGPSKAGADENDLMRQFSAAVEAINSGKFVEGRKSLDALEQTAGRVPPGDPSYRRAQDLLKRLPEARRVSFQNSANASRTAAEKAVQAADPAEAARHWKQAVADLEELTKLAPNEKRYAEDLVESKRRVAQCQVVAGLFQGREPDDKLRAAAGETKPKPLYVSAPTFLLPPYDKTAWIDPFSKPGEVVVVQLWGAADESALFAVESIRALSKQYGPRGVRIVSAALDDGNGLAKLDEIMKQYPPSVSAGIDDRAEMYQAYMQGGYSLPAYIAIGRDRRASWIDGREPIETAAGLAAWLGDEVAKPPAGLATPAVRYFPQAEPIQAVAVADGIPQEIGPAGKPMLLIVAADSDDGPHFEVAAALAKQYGDRLQTAVLVVSERFDDGRSAAEKGAVPVFHVRYTCPPVTHRTIVAVWSRFRRGGGFSRWRPWRGTPNIRPPY